MHAQKWKNGSPLSGYSNCLPPALHVLDLLRSSQSLNIDIRASSAKKDVLEGLSTRQIAELILSSRSTVAKHIGLAGIPLRPIDQCRRRRRGQVPYGSKLVAGILRRKPTEQAVIDRIVSLRAQNRSYREITAILDALKIRTKTGKSGWKAAAVMKILKSVENRGAQTHRADKLCLWTDRVYLLLYKHRHENVQHFGRSDTRVFWPRRLHA